LLALDASSTSIGAVVWNLDNDAVVKHEVWHAKDGATIGQRIAGTVSFVEPLCIMYRPLALAYEGPAYRTTPLALIVQQRVVGMVLYLAHERGLPTFEVPPATAKKALTNMGKANKDLMLRFAASYLLGTYTEHEADALGVAMAASGMIKHKEYAA
jgi:Holliday junction resolvasome RuvABC endonuclease subunit